MHKHTADMPMRLFLFDIMSDELPVPRVEQIIIQSPCPCGLQEFLLAQDLPFEPAFISLEDVTHDERYQTALRSSRSS